MSSNRWSDVLPRSGWEVGSLNTEPDESAPCHTKSAKLRIFWWSIAYMNTPYVFRRRQVGKSTSEVVSVILISVITVVFVSSLQLHDRFVWAFSASTARQFQVPLQFCFTVFDLCIRNTHQFISSNRFISHDQHRNSLTCKSIFRAQWADSYPFLSQFEWPLKAVKMLRSYCYVHWSDRYLMSDRLRKCFMI